MFKIEIYIGCEQKQFGGKASYISKGTLLLIRFEIKITRGRISRSYRAEKNRFLKISNLILLSV